MMEQSLAWSQRESSRRSMISGWVLQASTQLTQPPSGSHLTSRETSASKTCSMVKKSSLTSSMMSRRSMTLASPASSSQTEFPWVLTWVTLASQEGNSHSNTMSHWWVWMATLSTTERDLISLYIIPAPTTTRLWRQSKMESHINSSSSMNWIPLWSSGPQENTT